MRRGIAVWLVSVLVAGTFVVGAVPGMVAATPVLVEQWHKEFGAGSLYEVVPSPSAGLSRALSQVGDSCDLGVVVGSEEIDGLWHSMAATDGEYHWLKDTESYRAASSVAVTDIDEDGIDEAVGATLGGTLEVMKATTGEFVWTFPNPPTDYKFWGRSSPAVADIMPGVPGLEVVTLHSPTSTIYAFQGKADLVQHGIILTDYIDTDLIYWKDLYDSGQLGQEPYDWDLLWFADLRDIGGTPPGKTEWEFSTPAIADIDADGDLDIVVGSRNGYLYMIDGQDGSILSYYETGWMSASPAVANVNDDPQLEIFIESDGDFYALRWDSTLSGLEAMWTIPGLGGFSSAAIGDIDEDGSLEVVVGSSSTYVSSIDAASGDIEWYADVGGLVYSSPALAGRSSVTRWETTWPFFRGNVQRTGYTAQSGEELAVYVGADDSSISLLKGTDGSIIDRFFVEDFDSIYASPVVGDVDGDYKLEIGIPSSVYGMGPTGGESEDSYPDFWLIEDTGSSGSGDTVCGEPVADFSWWRSTPNEGEEISFTDLSYDTMGEIVQREWDFGHPGGGPTSSLRNPTHTYGDDGFFEVTLTVWDDDGNSVSVTKIVEVLNVAPTLEVWETMLEEMEPRTHGFWKQQCYIEEPDENHPGIREEFIEFIESHSIIWTQTSKEEICYILERGEEPDATMLEMLEMHLIALWLNIAWERMYWDTPLRHPGTTASTVGEFIEEAENAISTGQSGEYERLKDVADDILNDDEYIYIDPVAGQFHARATDPGSDDLTFQWFCDQDSTDPDEEQTVFNDGVGPDPYPSPDGNFPFEAEGAYVCPYTQPQLIYNPRIVVFDDDDGIAEDEDPGDPWSADFTFDFTLEYVDIGYGFFVPVVTATYLEYDSCVRPINPHTGGPLGGFGGSGGGKATPGSGDKEKGAP